jgi:protein-disulfide isomerase
MLLFNLYATFNLSSKLDAISGRMAMPVVTEKQGQVQTQKQSEASDVEGPKQPSVNREDPFKGSPDAPVTIVEFSDFQCPYCARFYKNTLPQIEEKYIKTGKVKLIYKDFPLSFHQYAQKAAEAAECADEQGKFWEYHDKLFENQSQLDVASLKRYAAELGLDTQAFNECLDSGKMAAEVQQDFNEGKAKGVSGTPTFFINGQKLVGAQPFEAFERIIEEKLKG